MKKFIVVFLVIIAMVLLTFAVGNGEQKASLEGVLKRPDKPPEVVKQGEATAGDQNNHERPVIGGRGQKMANLLIRNEGALYLNFYVDDVKACEAQARASCSVEIDLGKRTLAAKTENGRVVAKKTAVYSDAGNEYLWRVIY